MARKSTSANEYGTKHPLIVYRFIARRYRPVGLLFFVLGLLAQLPLFIAELRPQNTFITPETLSYIGLGSLVIGALILITSIFEARRAYVQCQPHYLLINTASGRVAMAYKRINTTKTVRVGDVFDYKAMKGRHRGFVRPVRGETALEVLISDYPLPEKKIRRRLSPLLFTTRGKGFLFIVPDYGKLNMEINTFTDRARLAAVEAERQEYLDPIERMRQQTAKS